MSQKKLPADPLSMTLGIISLLLAIGSCFVSMFLFFVLTILAIIPFVLLLTMPFIVSIIGIITANRSLRIYRKNPGIYSESSRNNVRTGRIFNSIVLFFSLLTFLVLIGGGSLVMREDLFI